VVFHKPRTLEDFPKFTVTTVRRGETSSTGYTEFKLEGTFDRAIQGIESHWFWLLIGTDDCLSASLEHIDSDTLAAVLTCSAKDIPNLLGETLFYLSNYWQAFNVWMVLDPNWGWKRVQFEARDAMAYDHGELKMWRKPESADDQNPHLHRIRDGWDHEHCTLCGTHIYPRQFGYHDPDDRWMCEGCYQKYVIPRDLAFVDEL
jgi:hypothetical protein